MPNPKKKAPKKGPVPVKPQSPETSEAAYKATAVERAALTPERFATINLDIPQAVAQALGVLPHLGEYRAQIVKDLPNHPIAAFDNLQTYTLAAYYAHIVWLPPESAENRLATLIAEAAPLRGNLLADAETLARRGLLDADAVATIRAGQGNVDMANDLVGLAALFTSKWEAIQNRTAATTEEINRAGQLGPQLLAELGVRQHGILPTTEIATEERRRAYTLFVHAYDETRRAIAYLRWHEGDADDIIPSLYRGRGGRAKEEEAAKPAEAKPEGAKSEGAKSEGAKSEGAKPEGAKSEGAKPTDAKSTDTAPTADAKPTDAKAATPKADGK